MTITRLFGYVKKLDFAHQVLKVLRLYGYFKSIGENKPLDFSGNPIPWYTYPAIEFLKQFDYRNKKIFEWGAGYSSLFWGRLADSVLSAERIYAWYQNIKARAINYRRLTIVYCPKKNDYIKLIKNGKGKYDIIVIDGEFRDECSKLAPRYLKKGGIIILDNSDWHRNIAKNFRELGFLQIDFKGFGALNTYTWVTSIFYKNTFNFRGVSEQLPTNPIGFIDPKNFK